MRTSQVSSVVRPGCWLDKAQRPAVQAWCRPKRDLCTYFSLDQTEHFFKEGFLIYLASPSIWHINSQMGSSVHLSYIVLKSFFLPQSETNRSESQGRGSVCSVETAGNVRSLHLTQASSLASGSSLQVLARSFSPRGGFCILGPWAPQPPRGPLHSEGPASFKKSLVPCLVANLNAPERSFIHTSQSTAHGFPPEIKVAKGVSTSAGRAGLKV